MSVRFQLSGMAVSIGMLMGMIACSTEPEPLVYGTDSCYLCKMTLVDKKFGAEVVTTKGKIYKFDDVNCFLNFYNSGYVEIGTIEHLLVVDYLTPGKLILAKDAFYLKSNEIRSPMNGQIACFETKAAMDPYRKQWKGIYLAWGEVVTQFK